MNHALDACAIIAYLRNEAGGSIVDGLLTNPTEPCCAHVINICEVYYDFIRKYDEPTARRAIKDLYDAGVVERRDVSRAFMRQVGQLKARGRISLADCFCIALALKVTGEVVTTDHHEFDALVPSGIVPIRFIR